MQYIFVFKSHQTRLHGTRYFGWIICLCLCANLDCITKGNIYLQPKYNNSNATVTKFIDEIASKISKLCKENKNTFVIGDLNLDLLKIDERE